MPAERARATFLRGNSPTRGAAAKISEPNSPNLQRFLAAHLSLQNGMKKRAFFGAITNNPHPKQD
jgi:hypothetical protein